MMNMHNRFDTSPVHGALLSSLVALAQGGLIGTFSAILLLANIKL